MKNLTLKAYLRDQAPADQALVPAEVYGPKIDNLHVMVEALALDKIFDQAAKSTLIDLQIEGQGSQSVLIRAIQRDPLTLNIIHVDFLAPDPQKIVKVKIDLQAVGKSQAVANLGGILVTNMDTIEVRALPQDLMSKIEVDLSQLAKLNDVIRVEDLQLPDSMTVLNDSRAALFSVIAPRQARKDLESVGDSGVEEVATGEAEAVEGEAAKADGEASESEEKSADDEANKDK